MSNVKTLVIFDGDCGMCNRTISFLSKRDKKNKLETISSVSKRGMNIIKDYNIPHGLEKETIIVISRRGKILTKSYAIRAILLDIPYYNIPGYIMFIFPKYVSDIIYTYISKNRHKISCKLPN